MLKRKYARLCIVLMALSYLLLIFVGLLYGMARPDSQLWGGLGIGASAVCLFSHLFVRYRYLKCPACGESLARPRWYAGQRSYCACCGEPFVYDDEAEN